VVLRRLGGVVSVASALATFLGPCQALAQATQPAPPQSVTIFDPWYRPYTAYGRPEAGGAVIVFDQPAPIAAPVIPAPAPAALRPVAIPAPPPGPAPLLDLGPPLKTAAGGATAAPAAAAEKPDPLNPTNGKHYKNGVYIADTDYLLSFPQNAYRLLTAPARFDKSDWITTALVIGAGGAILMLDEPLMDFWRNEVKSGFTGDVSDVAQELGERTDIVLGATGAYILAELVDSTGLADARREKSAALLSLESFLLTHGIVGGLKYVTGRKRPDESEESFDFKGPSEGDFNASFPSGHAGGAFAVASVLSEIYGYDNPWVPYLAYTLATGTALARVDDNRHWFSDVFASGAIGYAVGKTVTRYSPFLERNNITLVPVGGGDTYGVGVNYKY
jgi:hypothetical protein